MWNTLDDKKKEVFFIFILLQKYTKEHDKANEFYKKEYEAWLKKYKLEDKKVKECLKAIK